MTTRFNARTSGLKPFMKKVVRRQNQLNDMAPAYKRAVALYHAWILRNFAAEGGLHDNRSLKWKKSNRARDEGGKTLQKTGRLRRDWELRSGSTRGIIRSKVHYSGIHNDGGIIPAMVITPKKKKALRWVGSDGVVHFAKKVNRPAIVMPQRKIFPEISQARKIIMPAFEDHLDWNKVQIR